MRIWLWIIVFFLGGLPLGKNTYAQEEVETSPPASEAVPMVAPLETAIPDFHLTRIKVDAEVVNERVNIEATIEIVINRGEGWHRIPLRFGQAHVWSREYNGPGEELPDTNTKSVDDGIFWLLKGLGKHELVLKMWVPYKRTQLQLSLPPLPNQFETELTLRIPDPTAVIRGGKSVTVLDVVRDTETSTVRAGVAGPRLDISWHKPATQGAQVSQVGTRLHLKQAADRMMLIVDQSIEAFDQTAQELKVRLPKDFQLVSVSGERYRSHAEVLDEPGWWRVQLKTSTSKRVDLHWVLSRPLVNSGERFVIDGFQYEGAVREEGMIRIDEFDEYRFVPQLGDSSMIHRANVSEVKSFGVGTPLSAFAYFKQPFELAFDMAITEPYTVAKSLYDLDVQDDHLLLKTRTRLNVSRGAISQLEVDWPTINQWERVSVQSDDPANPVTLSVEESKATLTWTKPVTAEASLNWEFRKEVQVDSQQPLNIELPIPRATRTEPGWLLLRGADHLSFELPTDAGMQLVTPQSLTESPVTAQFNLPEAATAEVAGIYRLNSHVFNIIPKVQERSINVNTLVQIREFSHGELAVRQTAEFVVEYGRLRELEIRPPEELTKYFPEFAITETVDIYFEGERLRSFFALGLLKVVLPRPIRGRFELQMDYSVQVDLPEGKRDINLPFVTIHSHPYQSVKCSVQPLETVLVPPSEKWTAIRNSLWIAAPPSEAVTHVPLVLDYQLANTSQQFIVDRAWFRTRFLPDGRSETWAEFTLLSPPPRVSLIFPKDCEINDLNFLLDGRQLDRSALTTRTEDRRQVTISLPPQRSTNPILVVRYRPAEKKPFQLTSEINVEFPLFPHSVWVNETWWELQLPRGIHLFTYPQLDPQLEWTRKFVFWQRRPTQQFLADREAYQSGFVPAEFAFEVDDFYAFRGFGPNERVTFRSMNQSLILLIGAGITLCLGFLFWRIPSTRNIFSLLVLAFLFSTASLWFLEPLQLLLQPAVLGVVLALTATAFDSMSRRRTQLEQDWSERSTPASGNYSGAAIPTRIYQPHAGSSQIQE